MAKNAKDNGPGNNEARKMLQNILREPLTQRRLFLAAKLNAAKNPMDPQPFTADEFEKFIVSIPDTHNMMVREIEKVRNVIKTGITLEQPDIGNPSSQLLWGATLAWLKLNPDAVRAWDGPVTVSNDNAQINIVGQSTPPEKPKPVDLTRTQIWKQLTGSKIANDEMLQHANQIRETLRSKPTKYGWSAPGTGVQYDRQKDVIQIDLMQNLISGFEHARADIHRQVGFAKIVRSYPQKMNELSKEMQPLMLKAQKASAKKGPQLKPDEYKKLRLLSAEWQLRHTLFMAAEGNTVNRYATDLKFQQDIGVSVNNAAVTTRGIGLVSPVMGDQDMSDELKRYLNLCHTVELSFFQNNNLFPDTDQAWKQAGVEPQLVRTIDSLRSAPDDARGIEHPDFQMLRELCGGKDGLEHQQVGQIERMFGNFLSRVEARDVKRKEIIEEIEQKFTEHLVQKILQQVNDQVQQDLDQAQQNNQDGPPQDGEEQEGQDGQGQPQDGQGQGKGKGKPQKGKPQKGQGGGGGEPGDDDGEGSEGQEKGKKGDKGQKQQGGGKGDEQGQDGEGEDGQDGQGGGKQDKKDQKDTKDGKDQKGGGAEGELGKDENKNVPVEGAGEMPGVQDAADTPENEGKSGRDNDGQDGQDSDGKDSDGKDSDADADGDAEKTLEQMLKEKAEREAQEAQEGEGQGQEAEGQSAEGQDGQGGKPKKSGGKKAGHGGNKSLGDLAKEDWTKYEDRVNELRGPIARARKLFKQVQEKQLQPKKAISKQLDILPENGEVMERFNLEAHRNLIIKKSTRDVQEQDLKRFQTDERTMVPTEIDVVILIDASGSMVPHPLDSALQAGAILFEAANGKDMKMNVYVGLWGNDDPPILIKPGDTPTQIGQAMQGARRGLNCGTDLAPAIRNTAKVIGEQRGRAGTLSGFTHILVISDGEIGDAPAATKAIETLFTCSDKTTIDTAVINSNKQTEMDTMIKGVGKKTTRDYHVVGAAHEFNPDLIPDSILGLLLDKIRKCGSFKAVPNTEKRRAMKKAHDKMEGKNRP